jgi:glucosamine--fructose-6-phosphate aminotransferase (isomerizing)
MEENNKQGPRWVGGVEPAKELLTATGTQILEFECRQQPERLRQLLTAYASDAAIQGELQQFRQLAQKKGPVLFVGMGASYCSSISGSVLLQ